MANKANLCTEKPGALRAWYCCSFGILRLSGGSTLLCGSCPICLACRSTVANDTAPTLTVLCQKLPRAFSVLKLTKQKFLRKPFIRHTSYVPRPAELRLFQDGVNAGQTCTCKDLSIRDLFLPANIAV
ncbi:uncharacterized protein LOC125559147 [Nematostella vectensis]|uniref:uncharacterized protein LOC125559147 n=1 Tax=Nematostella vectensis TaxID=45351 RepID=UPI002076EEAF|nr:uncharacterized protein LOC125559147 [Nematostella vectensis]